MAVAAAVGAPKGVHWREGGGRVENQRGGGDDLSSLSLSQRYPLPSPRPERRLSRLPLSSPSGYLSRGPVESPSLPPGMRICGWGVGGGGRRVAAVRFKGMHDCELFSEYLGQCNNNIIYIFV